MPGALLWQTHPAREENGCIIDGEWEAQLLQTYHDALVELGVSDYSHAQLRSEVKVVLTSALMRKKAYSPVFAGKWSTKELLPFIYKKDGSPAMASDEAKAQIFRTNARQLRSFVCGSIIRVMRWTDWDGAGRAAVTAVASEGKV